tara:strand:- start:678 stop:1046 length:369 start_codon:yes stop_codon:yes gene_type:complete
MGKLLETRLPIAQGNMVSIDTFNRLVRIMELNLGRFDNTATPQYTDVERNSSSFSAGDVIWNTTTEELQVYDGDAWVNLSVGPQFGLEAKASIGAVTVTLDGNVTVNITGPVYGWDKEQWYT